PPESSDHLQTTRGRGGAAAWGISVRSCGLACEQFLLLGPVQRQIEFGQPRRSEFDGLPALQDRLDELRAQEGETNESANVAPGNAVTLGQLLERSGTAGGEFLKPCAPPRNRLENPGRTNLVSVPRRVKATAAVSSIALSHPSADADDGTSPPKSAPRCSLMMIVFSSTMIFSTSSRTSF